MANQKSVRKTYLFLRDFIAERIDLGIYQANEKLPSERELAMELETTRLTLRDALSQLEVEGKVFRMDRRGWYVSTKRLVFDPTQDIGFMSNVHQQGQIPTTKLISSEEETASAALAKALKISVGDSIYHLQRKRWINKRPVLIEDIYLDASRYPGLHHTNLTGSLTLVLAEVYKVAVQYSQIEIIPVAFNQLHAKSLHVSPGTPATLITRISYDKDGQVVEFDKEYWVSDVLKIQMRTLDKP